MMIKTVKCLNSTCERTIWIDTRFGHGGYMMGLGGVENDVRHVNNVSLTCQSVLEMLSSSP